MKKTVVTAIFFACIILCNTVRAQQKGFFYSSVNTEGHNTSACCSLETNDGDFLIAVYDNNNSNSGLIKLSKTGKLLDELTFSPNEDSTVVVKQIFRHPELSTRYIAVGYVYRNGEIKATEYCINPLAELNS